MEGRNKEGGESLGGGGGGELKKGVIFIGVEICFFICRLKQVNSTLTFTFNFFYKFNPLVIINPLKKTHPFHPFPRKHLEKIKKKKMGEFLHKEGIKQYTL